MQFQHQTIEELILNQSEEQLRFRPLPAKWSAFENIVHLISYQHIFQQRIQKILTGNTPSFDRYVADNDILFNSYLQKTLPELLENLYSIRNQIYHQLTRLSSEQIVYKALHPVYGTLGLVQWIEFFLLHESYHLFTVFKLVRESAEGSRN